jgi:class I fructose-bisphosphate aldolase
MPTASPRVKEIMSWYASENPGVQANLYRMLMTGRLAGTGKFVILPVDQGFEHGPARSFAPNPPGYDPRYHYQLAIDAGCNAYAAPLGSIEAGAAEYAGQVPLILKVNNHDLLFTAEGAPLPAVTSGVDDALRLGCGAIGFTIYPGSGARTEMYEELRELTAEAKAAGLAVVVWSYPRGVIPKEAETAVDVAAYAAQIAAQLGANIVKVKPPVLGPWDKKAAEALEKSGTRLETLADRVKHVIQGAFGGRRIVIFSGGEAKGVDEVLEENRQTALGGGFGTIMGRNSFQRPHDEAVELLHKVMDIHASTWPEG